MEGMTDKLVGKGGWEGGSVGSFRWIRYDMYGMI